LVSSFAPGYGLYEKSKQLVSNLAFMTWFNKLVLTPAAILPEHSISSFYLLVSCYLSMILF